MGVWCWGEVRGVCRGEGLSVDSMQESYGAGSAHSSDFSLLTRIGDGVRGSAVVGDGGSMR